MKPRLNPIRKIRMKHVLSSITLAVISGVLPLFASDTLEREFVTPPDSARPGVYWYFLNGNFNRTGMTADLEAMKAAGLGTVLYLEVGFGPRGPMKFMSQSWLEAVAHAIRETDRLGMNFAFGVGPGWCAAGGPWVKPEKAMQHLVFSEVEVKGPSRFESVLPIPAQRRESDSMVSEFYEDVAVFAVPSRKPVIEDIDEKAFYVRQAYTSYENRKVKPYLEFANYDLLSGNDQAIRTQEVVEITPHLNRDGLLKWDVPAGNWTLVRMGRRPTGTQSRPAPLGGEGLDTDKLEATAIIDHLNTYVGAILEKVGPKGKTRSFNDLHLDSWESSSQNWTGNFLKEFKKRRGYDARPLLPIYTGRAIKDVEYSERFLWDVRKTTQELLLENHAQVMKKWAHERGMVLSIEPYDKNPAGDLDLGAIADVPMAEFWTAGGGRTAYSCIEATSVAHLMGRPVVGSEAFTSIDLFGGYPGGIKEQTDWAFAIGINSFWFHTYAHQPFGEDVKPGMTFGPYGTTWHRNQTWWPMVDDVHKYISRCSHMLRQGVTVSDILYLTPEGVPLVFRPPLDATAGTDFLPDKKGFGFDGCSPLILSTRAGVKEGQIVFPGGTSYRLMVLSQTEKMTPVTLRKIRDLVKEGATVVGAPPQGSPSLSGYPACDSEVKALAKELWGSLERPSTITRREFGKGAIYWGGDLTPSIRAKLQDPFLDCQWLWYPGENGANSAPAGMRYFKRVVECDGNKKIKAAKAYVVADNAFTLLVNGKKVAEGNQGGSAPAEAISIESHLVSGKNSIGVMVNNAGSTPNPAGLLASVQIEYEDGSISKVRTDKQWIAGNEATSGWEAAGTELKNWRAAEVIAELWEGRWGKRDVKNTPPYPSYAVVADLLKSMGTVEDFSTSGPVRYAHRRTETQEIYFVSNRSDQPVETECQFRVGSGEPEVWDPMTGEQWALPKYKQQDKVTSIPMTFGKHQSYFVIFNKTSGTKAPQRSVNFPVLKQVEELQGPWEVGFDPKWGGPAKVTFDSLTDWSKNDDSGIKYYSGIATYRKSFVFQPASGKRVYLDLGVVHNAARVRLNGKDLGAVWCAPWQIELTRALKTGANALEIDVANLWPNRLIGDQLPENKGVRELKWADGLMNGETVKAGRYTYTQENHYNSPNHSLRASGLIGPVRLMECE